MQHYTVASGIIRIDDRIVLVQNRRRNGSLDWSTPGGVVDPGEGVIEALRREVREETALQVEHWSPMTYSVDVDFVGRDMAMHAEVYVACDVAGELIIDDPDGVVVDGRWVDVDEAAGLVAASPRWVAEPLMAELAHLFAGDDDQRAASEVTAVGDQCAAASKQWKYVVQLGSAGRHRVELVDGPDA